MVMTRDQATSAVAAERALRGGLEKSYRALARLAPDEERRLDLVDVANEVRPRTWW
jgi:serine/threonine-protein kinase PknG